MQYRTGSDTGNPATSSLPDPVKLQFFYDNKNVAGFGWLNDAMFCYGQYAADMVNDSNERIADELILRSQKLEQIEYLKKEGDQPTEGETPLGFAITLFHICFLYHNNITVISKLSKEIVYSQNFRDEKVLRGIHLDTTKNQLLAYCPQKIIQYAYLKGEDKDAWKYYLKKNKIYLALASCNTPKLRAQCNGLWAESLLQRGNYTQAAKFFAKSNFSFEAVAMKFLKFNQINGLQDYIKNVL